TLNSDFSLNGALRPAGKIGTFGEQEGGVKEARLAWIVWLERPILFDGQEWVASRAKNNGIVLAGQFLKAEQILIVVGERIAVAGLQSHLGNADRRCGRHGKVGH